MPVSRYRYQIYVRSTKTVSGWSAYYGTNNKTQWIAVQYKLRRQGRRFKTRVKTL